MSTLHYRLDLDIADVPAELLRADDRSLRNALSHACREAVQRELRCRARVEIERGRLCDCGEFFEPCPTGCELHGFYCDEACSRECEQRTRRQLDEAATSRHLAAVPMRDGTEVV